ncbi:MAG: CapA family protein [Chloroflexi bacterium]|nr:CapA family protein [Chloroflexota bacterium]
MRRCPTLLLVLLICAAIPCPGAAQGPEPLRLVLVGDVMVGRHVADQISVEGDDYPLEAVWPLLQGADLAIGNLESPLTVAPRTVQNYNLTTEPAKAHLLSKAGFDLLSVANNHATDHGVDGLVETVQALADVDIAALGYGVDAEAARAPLILDLKGLRLAFLAYEGLGAALPAGKETPGTLHLQPLGWAERDVRAAREAADWVIVGVHWGEEYEPLPNAYQQTVAQSLADAGADVIWGHHPHILQPLAWLQGKGRTRPTLVAYSLGNFLFDQGFSFETSTSAALTLVLEGEAYRAVGLTPLATKDGAVGPAAPADGEAILAPLWAQDWFAAPWTPAEPAEGQAASRWWLSETPAAQGFPSQAWALRWRGQTRLYVGRNLAWRSPPGVQVSAWAAADLDGDGANELLVSEWNADGFTLCVWAQTPESLPGAPLWGRQVARLPLDQPLVALASLAADGQVLAALAGPGQPAGVAAHLERWAWDGQGFQPVWSSPTGAFRGWALRDLHGDGRSELLLR